MIAVPTYKLLVEGVEADWVLRIVDTIVTFICDCILVIFSLIELPVGFLCRTLVDITTQVALVGIEPFLSGLYTLLPCRVIFTQLVRNSSGNH